MGVLVHRGGENRQRWDSVAFGSGAVSLAALKDQCTAAEGRYSPQAKPYSTSRNEAGRRCRALVYGTHEGGSSGKKIGRRENEKTYSYDDQQDS